MTTAPGDVGTSTTTTTSTSYSFSFAVSERLVLVALFACVTLVAILTVTPWPVGVFQDDAIYTVVGKSLAEGTGYRQINLPGEPHATRYPPAYPLVIAALWKLWPSFPDNIVLFKFANAVFLGVTALATYAFSRARLAFGVGTSAVVAVLGTLSVVVLLITGVVMSEPMYMMVAMIALLRAERLADSPTVRDAVIVGLLLGLLALVRTVGGVIVPAAVLVLAFRRQWKTAFVTGAVASALIVPWLVWTAAYEHEIPAVFAGKFGSYGAWLELEDGAGGLPFVWAVAKHNLLQVDGFLGFYGMPVTARWARLVGIAVQGLLLLVGSIALLRRAPVSALYMGAYMIVVLAWPFEPTRFLLALWPLLMATYVLGALSIWRWRPSLAPMRAARLVAIAGVAAIVAGSLTYNWRGYTAQWWVSIQRNVGRRAATIAGWVARNTAPTDRVAIDHDLVVYLYTGRQAVPTGTFLPSEYLTPLSPEQVQRYTRDILAAYDVRYFATGSVPNIEAAEALADATPPALVRIGSMREARIYAPAARR